MQFDADHLFALAGYAESDPAIMANHASNGVPAIVEREYGITIDLLRLFKGDEAFSWFMQKLLGDERKLRQAQRVYQSELPRLAVDPAPSAGGSAVPRATVEPCADLFGSNPGHHDGAASAPSVDGVVQPPNPI